MSKLRKLIFGCSIMLLMPLFASEMLLDFNSEYFSNSLFDPNYDSADPYGHLPELLGGQKNKKKSHLDHNLDGILYKKNAPVAIVDGHRYRKGEAVSESLYVNQITPDYVVLRTEENEFKILIPQKSNRAKVLSLSR